MDDRAEAAGGAGTIGEASLPAPSTLKSASGLVDFVQPAGELAARIGAYIDRLAHLGNADKFEELLSQVATQLTRIAGMLRNKTGHDFHGYKQNTFLRRIQRRMQVTQTDSVDAYLEVMRADPEEVQHLFNDLLIGVTHFFRDQKEFEFLDREVVPKLFEGKETGDQLRVWVPGCATGEEAYSIAILLREHMARIDAVPHVQIFATDIDGRALAQARIGRYSEAAVRAVTPERLARWFVKEGSTYCIVKELREMCIFSQHSIIKDAPFSRLDLVSCRNLLIYLNSDLQNRVIPLFHFALKPSGHLFLGNSETIARHAKLFAPLDRRFRIFRRVETPTRVLPELPLTTIADRRLAVDAIPRVRPVRDGGSLTKQAERLIERYAPAYMIVDESYEVQHFSGRTGRYIDPTSGMASLNLLHLIHRDLRPDVRAALHKAETRGKAVRIDGLRMELDGRSMNVSLAVEPVDAGPGRAKAFAVVLHDGRITSDEASTDDDADISGESAQDDRVQRLEAELKLTQDRLQATIEELESTNEELKSANEEYQSVNEELQSSNEEMETSKEELQSLNEELHTVNGELAHRVHELGRANSDLKNLLESTQIATVFLDNELRIKNFTPAITDIFHLVDTDLGRPISHIAARIDYEDLEGDARRAIRTLTTIEREARNLRTGARYLTRVLPYRSIDNVIEGAVLTFLDVTPVIEAKEQLDASEERLRALTSGLPQLIWTAGQSGEWTWVGPQWVAYTGLTDPQSRGWGWLAAVHPDDREPTLAASRAAKESGNLKVEHRVRQEAGSAYRWFQTQATPIYDRDGTGRIVEWFGTSTDVDDLRRLQEHQKLLLAELQHRVRNILGVVRSLARRTARTSKSLEEYASHLEGRIDALARTQSILTRAPSASVALEQLIEEELAAQEGAEGRQVSVVGPDIRLRAKAADTLGLAIHELATNAVKYGALATPKGRINVSWTVTDGGTPPRLVLHWEESGVEINPSALSRRGFGRDLIEHNVPYELGATSSLEFLPDGVRCTLEMPLTDRLVHAEPMVSASGKDTQGKGGEDD